MENPATWGKAEKVVNQVLQEERDRRAKGEIVVGLSLTRRITDALRAEGLLKDRSSDD